MNSHKKNLIPFFSWAQLYNLYFIFVVGRTFNSCIQDNKFTGSHIEGNLEAQKKSQKKLLNEIFELAKKYPEFSSSEFLNSDGTQNIDKPITKEFYRNIVIKSPKKGLWRKKANTSGSSGVSLTIERSPKAFLNSQISFYKFLNQFNIIRFEKNIYIGGARKEEKSYLKKIIKFFVFKITGTYKFVASDMVNEIQYKKFIEVYELIKPTYIHGFSSALLRIADYIETNNIKLKWKPKLVHPNAEGLSDSQRERLKKIFCSPVAMVYGSAECHMASECKHGIMHVNMRSCDLKTDSHGAAILSVFESDYMPLINYQMGDIIKIDEPKSPCDCGKHTKVITDIIGRLADQIKLPSGRVLTHPDLNMLIFQLDEEKLIHEYQIIHYSGTNSVELRCSADDHLNLDKFSNLLNQRFDDVNFICTNNKFKLLANGKKPVILSVNQVPLPRKTYESYKPYFEISDSQSIQNDPNVLKLDWNESTNDFPLELKKQALDELSRVPLNLYPDLQVSNLKKAISKWLDIEYSCITIFNGSDAGIATICRLFLEDTDSVLTIEPTYGNYKGIASRYTRNVEEYKLIYPFELDFNNFKNFLKSNNQKLVFFTNPNNPSGVEYPREIIFDLSKNFPKTCFVLDEAYVEFGANSLSVQEIPDNVIILRTFSKAFGLAGVRLGYSLSTKKLAKKIALSKDNKEVDVFAQIVGSLAVNNPEYMYKFVKEVEKGRKIATDFFDKNNIEYLSGKGNYILFKVKNPNEVEEKLKSCSIFIRNRNQVENLEGYLRVTLGNELTMIHFTEALNKILQKY